MIIVDFYFLSPYATHVHASRGGGAAVEKGGGMHLRCVVEHVGVPAVAFWHELTVIRVTK